MKGSIKVGVEHFSWDRVRKFKRDEWKNNPEKVSQSLVWLVDELAIYVDEEYGQDTQCIIHVAYEVSDHAEDSQHYLGNAVDLHFTKISLLDQYLAAERFPFSGIGIYPYWNNPGLHLDIRDAVCGVRWWRDMDTTFLENGITRKKVNYKKLDADWFEVMIGMRNGN